MVKLHSSDVFVKDPIDIWGKEHTIGNAELAARLGSPSTFDRRGSVVYYEDYESSPLKFKDGSLAGGSVTLSDEYPLHGGGCMKLVTPSTNTHYAEAGLLIGGLASGRMGTEFTVEMKTDVKALVGVYMRATTGTRMIHSGISLQGKTDGGLRYLSGTDPTDSSHWSLLNDTFDIYTAVTYPVKFVVDFDNEKYVRCMFCGEEIDMSAYNATAVNSTLPKIIYWQVVSISVGASEISYMDNSILTINEPEN